MELICKKCNSAISPNNVNIASDLAKCDKCNSIHRASELIIIESPDKVNNPPGGSKMTIHNGFDGSVEIHYPKRGFRRSMIFQTIFIVFWISFMSVWTYIASLGSIFFAMFSIPFWLVGFGMIGGLLNSIYETQTIRLSGSSLSLKKIRPVRSKTFEVSVKDIQSVKMKIFKMNNAFSMFGNLNLMSKLQKSFMTGGIELPAIISGVKTEYFFEDANDAEQEWVTAVLNGMISRMKK